MLRYIILFLLSLLPRLVFAASTGPTAVGAAPSTAPSLFNPPATDLSIGYLGDIFGVVDGVLHGSGSQILGTMFGVFNSAVLTMGAIVVMYTLIVSTLNTAQQGSVLGEKWSSVWIPIRTVAGFALMAPKASGYSFIQIFVMWVVVQGVGAADTVWDAALTYLARGGTIIQASNPASLGLNSGSQLINPVAANIFKSQVCMYGIYNSLTNHAQDNPTNIITYPDFTGSVVVTGVQSGLAPPNICAQSVCTNPTCTENPSAPGCPKAMLCDCNGQVQFPGATAVAMNSNGTSGTNYAGVCGNASWDLAFDQNGGLAGGAPSPTSPFGQINNPSSIGAGTNVSGGQVGGGSDSRSIAVQQIVLDTQPLAQAVANIIVPPNNLISPTGGSNLPSMQQQLSGRTDVAGAAVDYMAIMLPYLYTVANGANQAAINLLTANEATGWILAGSYYYDLVSLNKQTSAVENSVPSTNYTGNFSGCPGTGGALCVKDYSALNTYLQAGSVICNGDTSSSSNAAQNTNINDFVCWNTQNIPQTNTGNSGQSAVGTLGLKVAIGIFALGPLFIGAITMLGPIAPLMAIILGGFLDVVNHVNALTSPGVEPLLAIADLGNTIVNWVEAIWLSGTILVFLTSAIMSISLCVNPLGMAYATAMMWFLPMMIAIFMAMLVAGATMAYYVPLIPFILFLFASIGWFAAVIEAMIASPIVALGIVNPEGHDVFGQAQHAILILANVFLRPTLIIFGFIFAAILSHVALWLLNQGYTNVVPHEEHDFMQLLSMVVLTVIYVGIVLTVMNRCFALIHEIPNKVMRWIGGGPEEFGEASHGQQVAQIASSGASAGQQALSTLGGQSETKGGGATGEMGQGVGKAASSASSEAGASAGSSGGDQKPAGGGGGGGGGAESGGKGGGGGGKGSGGASGGGKGSGASGGTPTPGGS